MAPDNSNLQLVLKIGGTLALAALVRQYFFTPNASRRVIWLGRIVFFGPVILFVAWLLITFPLALLGDKYHWPWVHALLRWLL